MHSAIIAVGSELTNGAKLDTNSQWLSVQLAAVGVSVRTHVTVADDMRDLVHVLRDAVSRADFVLITGGLGPTLDDLTREALAEVAGAPLELHQPSLDFIRSLFTSRNLEMPQRNIVQAMFPAGSEPIPNPRGTAPGIWMEIERDAAKGRAKIAALPGVPSEMRPMFQESVVPRLAGGERVIKQLRINCFGMGESKTEELLGELTARGRQPEVGITVHEATITLRITAHGRSPEECDCQLDAMRTLIRKRLGHLVFGEEDQELQHVLIQLLNDRNSTLATAESGTGGLLAHLLTGIPDSGRCYLGGIVAPTETARRALFGVDPNDATQQSATSVDVATQMASVCRERFGSDYALAIVESPSASGNQTKPAGDPQATVSLFGPDLLKVREVMQFGDRALMTSRTVKIAMNLLRRHLMRDGNGN